MNGKRLLVAAIHKQQPWLVTNIQKE